MKKILLRHIGRLYSRNSGIYLYIEGMAIGIIISIALAVFFPSIQFLGLYTLAILILITMISTLIVPKIAWQFFVRASITETQAADAGLILLCMDMHNTEEYRTKAKVKLETLFDVAIMKVSSNKDDTFVQKLQRISIALQLYAFVQILTGTKDSANLGIGVIGDYIEKFLLKDTIDPLIRRNYIETFKPLLATPVSYQPIITSFFYTVQREYLQEKYG